MRIKYNLTWRLRDYKKYKSLHGRYPNIFKPKTFGEKVLYRKRHHVNYTLCTLLADKIAVRDYVADKIGKANLIPILKIYQNSSDLADDFYTYQGEILKANHGSGMYYMIPTQASDNDLQKAVQLADNWLATDFSYKGEGQYKSIKRKIFVEKFLGVAGRLAIVYNFHMFKQKDGGINYVLQVIDEANGKDEMSFYINNLQDTYSNNLNVDISKNIEVLRKMLDLSQELLGELEYARVDWYILDGQPYFSEITLTHSCGLSTHINGELDRIMGELWDLSLSPYS